MKGFCITIISALLLASFISLISPQGVKAEGGLECTFYTSPYSIDVGGKFTLKVTIVQGGQYQFTLNFTNSLSQNKKETRTIINSLTEAFSLSDLGFQQKDQYVNVSVETKPDSGTPTPCIIAGSGAKEDIVKIGEPTSQTPAPQPSPIPDEPGIGGGEDKEPNIIKPIVGLTGVFDPLKSRFDSVGDIISSLLPSLIALAGMVALLFLIWGGIRYMSARGDPKAVDAARGTITSAIVGLIIILLTATLFGAIAAIFNINIFGLVGSPVYAQSESIDIGCAVRLGDQCISSVFPSFGSLITVIVRVAVFAAALIFFFMIIWGGFKYLSAGGDPKSADAARQTLSNALIGLLIVIASFIIIEIISQLTGNGSSIDIFK